MKIYLLFDYCGVEGDYYVETFSSLEKAQDHIGEILKQRREMWPQAYLQPLDEKYRDSSKLQETWIMYSPTEYRKDLYYILEEEIR